MEDKKKPRKPQKQSIFRKVAKWQDLHFYQKTDVLYQLTYLFCQRFLKSHGDRTVDQMVQAARSGKQNIVEGLEDGKTSMEMEIKLLNIGRSSIGELRQDYIDFLKARGLPIWTMAENRYQPMLDFTRSHNLLADYEPFLQKWSAEEMANVAITLCYQVDTMINKFLENEEQAFITEGGIKERMHQARTGFRQQQDDRLALLESTIEQLQQQILKLQEEAAHWRAAYDDLKARALKAYYQQQGEIKALKDQLKNKGKQA